MPKLVTCLQSYTVYALMYAREHKLGYGSLVSLLFLLHFMTQQLLPGNEIEINSIINYKY